MKLLDLIHKKRQPPFDADDCVWPDIEVDPDASVLFAFIEGHAYRSEDAGQHWTEDEPDWPEDDWRDEDR